MHAAHRKAFHSFLPFFLSVTFVFLPGVSAKIFSTVSCIGYDVDDVEKRRLYYLRSDLSVLCNDSETHSSLVRLMWVFVVVWPIGCVLLYIAVLIPCGDTIIQGKKTPLTAAASFLTHDYERWFFWWEPLELCRRVALTGWVLLVDEEYATAAPELTGCCVTAKPPLSRHCQATATPHYHLWHSANPCGLAVPQPPPRILSPGTLSYGSSSACSPPSSFSSSSWRCGRTSAMKTTSSPSARSCSSRLSSSPAY